MLSDLRAHERSVYSQGGEDGALAHLFECLGTTNRTFVEFGAWDGRHLSNTALLRLDGGWTGLLMDADPKRVNDLVQRELVTAENVNDLFSKYDLPQAFDLLSIDIDGNEYWVWEAICDYRPRVVIIEYNIFFSTDVCKTMPYNAAHEWDKTMFHGASLGALRKLGRKKGYSLIHTDSYTPNAIFVEDTELPARLVDLPIQQVAAWDWDPGSEPPIADGRSWMAV
ncbi:MAG: FkbM family methyltransferase [Myxococcota bacterium]